MLRGRTPGDGVRPGGKSGQGRWGGKGEGFDWPGERARHLYRCEKVFVWARR